MKTEIIKASDGEASTIEQDAGYLVRVIEPGCGMTRDQARAMAVSAARASGLRYGVFKVCEIAEPSKEKPGSELPSARLIARANCIRMGDLHVVQEVVR